jgi:uncharacterized protein YjbI with pentapeptide repeats
MSEPETYKANKEKLIQLLMEGKIELFNSIRPRPQLGLSGIFLAGKSGKYRHLAGVDWSQAALLMANLSWADLREAKLALADLSAADLHCALLDRANLRGAELSMTNLSRASLKQADFSHAWLARADFEEANLEGAIFEGAVLAQTNLRAVRGLPTAVRQELESRWKEWDNADDDALASLYETWERQRYQLA